MNIELPLYKQEKDNTCALACLRMVLAAFGTSVSEGDIEARARLEEKGTEIGELERLAREFNLVAEIQEATTEELQQILAAGELAIAWRARDPPPARCQAAHRHSGARHRHVGYLQRPAAAEHQTADRTSVSPGLQQDRRFFRRLLPAAETALTRSRQPWPAPWTPTRINHSQASPDEPAGQRSAGDLRLQRLQTSY
jgi:hypothetical protein